MRVRFARPLYWLAVIVAFLCTAPRANAQSDLSTVKARMLADAIDKAGFRAETVGYSDTDFSKADTYASSIGSNGSWSGIDYGDTSNDFPALDHLDHVLVMAYSYNQKADAAHYKSAALLAAMNKALGYWYQVNPKCSNWFKNDIAKQFYLGPIGLLMQGAIDAGNLDKIIGDLTDAPSMTGANRTALSTSVIYRAVIEGSTARLSSGVSGVASVIAVTSGDGVQRDFSFQQHGGILYNGNYGFAFLRDVTWVGAMLSGTQYAFSAAQTGLLRDNFLQGTRWMIRGGLLDYNVRGREVGSSAGARLKADDFLDVLDHFALIDPANASAYLTAKSAIGAQKPQDVSGVRHFWSSDYTAVQRASYFASLKMCSKRTIGMERNVNTENLLGYWLPYGLTYTHQRGDEYDYVFPIWDWARLPGVTSPHVEISITDNATTYTSQSTSFVGGASDGSYGASAMDFSLEQTKAKKSWFWFDREWVALGAGIESTHAKPIFTSVQQVLQKGTVLADGSAFSGTAKALTNPQWVLHDGVGYVFPEAQTVQIQASAQTGSVKRIFGLGSSATVSGNVFSLWFDHGTAPKGKTYQYVVVPGIDQAALAQYAQAPPIEVLSNTPALQAVTQLERRATGAVFFQAGSVSVPGGPSVKVDAPCIVVLNEPAGSVAVSDPNASLSKVTVTVTNVTGGMKSQAVTLPGGDSAGKSVIVATLLDKRPALDDGSAGGGSAGAPSRGMAGDTSLAGAGQGGAAITGGTSGIAGTPGMPAAGTPGTGGSAEGNPGMIGGGAPGLSGSAEDAAGQASSGGCGCSVPRGRGRGLEIATLGSALIALARRRRGAGRAVS
ncbi:MAG: polysaccharide lyase family 8 super-sandwich domain-containing protein [Myxococcales bacterium]